MIDTSSAAVSAAVVEARPQAVVLRSERVTVDARAHGELLAPHISQCLDEAGCRPGELGAVVAGVGPGPFTGLRVGLVTASMFGDLLGIPTYGVCSLDGIAASVGGSVLVAGDARRREIYWARYVGADRVAGPRVDRPGELPGLGGDARLAGAGARLYLDVLVDPAAGAPGGRLLDCDYPPMLALAGLAADRIRARAPGERLIPLYLRRPDAVAPMDYKAVTPR